MATHSSILAWRIPRLYSPWGRKESDTTEQLSRPRIKTQFSDNTTRHLPYDLRQVT